MPITCVFVPRVEIWFLTLKKNSYVRIQWYRAGGLECEQNLTSEMGGEVCQVIARFKGKKIHCIWHIPHYPKQVGT